MVLFCFDEGFIWLLKKSSILFLTMFPFYFLISSPEYKDITKKSSSCFQTEFFIKIYSNGTNPKCFNYFFAFKER